MNHGSNGPASDIAASWDTFWHGTGDVGAWTAGGVGHPAIRAFWDEFFGQAKDLFNAPSMLDIATGNGALLEAALRAFRGAPLRLSCVDISEAAVSNITKRFPKIQALACDAREIPLDDHSFDIVTSQFGVEYAGLDAVDEAYRLLAPGGFVVLLIHHSEGVITAECSESLQAIARLEQTGFIPLANDLLTKGFAAVNGSDRAPYEEAASRLQPAVEQVEIILQEHGRNVAGGSITQLYNDIARIHESMPAHDAEQVLAWAGRLADEYRAYAGRMSSMISAAIDQPTFESLCEKARSKGYSIEQADPIFAAGTELPLGWLLIAESRLPPE